MQRIEISINHFFVIVMNASSIHKSGHLAFVLIELIRIIVHSPLLIISRPVKKISQVGHAVTAKNTEDITLLWCEFGRCLTAESGKVFS